MPAIRTKQPITSINAGPHPQANRVAKEEYLTYSYPNLTLFEDFSSGVARKTKWFAVLKDKEETKSAGGEIPKGIDLHHGAWRLRITIKGKRQTFTFPTLEEAKAAKIRYGKAA